MAVASPNPTQSLGQFAEVVRQHQSLVCAVAYGVTGDRALSEDIAQETFVAAWQGLSTLRDPSKLPEWLRGIARNLAHKALRKVARVDELQDYEASDDLARDAIAKDDASVAWAALRELPEAYREALVLYYWGDLSAKQVAGSLGVTEATAMQRLSRGRTHLRDHVARIVEGTLRRARPGAVLTATILAAVAATTAGTATAATASGGTASTATASVGTPSAAAASVGTASAATASVATAVGSRHVARRLAWKTGMTLLVLGMLATFGASIAGSSRTNTGTAANADTPATVMQGSSRDDSDILPSGPTTSNGATSAHEPLAAGDDLDSNGMFFKVLVSTDEKPSNWLTHDLREAPAACFVEYLIDHPARIEIAVRDGKIATVTVAAFDGASPRVVAIISPYPSAEASDPRTGPARQLASALAPHELVARLEAGLEIATHPDNPVLGDHDKAMPLAEFVGLCAKARFVGQPVSGPDATHQLTLSGSRFIPKTIDQQGYVDLDVPTGMSRGPASAKVTIVTFLDIADGFGGKSISALTEVLAKYPNDVRVVVKLCPSKVAGHDLAAEAIHAANAQGALWPMLERVAANRTQLGLEDLVRHAATLHLDTSRFRDDLVNYTFREAIELDQDQMVTMDIHALPSAIVGSKRVHGALPALNFVMAVEEALASAN